MQEIKPETLWAEDIMDAKRWSMLVGSSTTPDVYYLPEYARATAEIEQAEPIALIVGAPSSRILAPLLIRRTSGTMNGSAMEWLDASTPYGYGGLLNLSDRIHPETFHDFFHQLHGWCSDRRIVCCVIRLHPLIAQQDWFDPAERWQDRLQIHSRGSTASIELSKWSEKLDQPISLRRDRRADMRLAGRTLRVTWGNGEDDDVETKLDIFSGLYDKLIDYNRAESFYRFPRRYFTKLARLGKRLSIALAWHRDDPVGGNLFLVGSRYAHGHLAATNDAGRKYGASTLLIMEGARWARQHGCELLHLGGGMRPGDSLENYKRSFGGPTHVYRYLTFIADPNMFETIRGLPGAPWPYKLDPSRVEVEQLKSI